jgi:hypothetical protein
MSGANEATAALQSVAGECYRSTFETGSAFARSHTAVAKATDIVETLQATIDMLIAAEALSTAAETSVKALRAVLSSTMNDVGAASIQATHHSAHLAKKQAFLNVSDEDAIPREFFVQPPVHLDKRAVKSALTDGIQVPGVSLAYPNEMTLVIRNREAKA